MQGSGESPVSPLDSPTGTSPVPTFDSQPGDSPYNPETRPPSEWEARSIPPEEIKKLESENGRFLLVYRDFKGQYHAIWIPAVKMGVLILADSLATIVRFITKKALNHREVISYPDDLGDQPVIASLSPIHLNWLEAQTIRDIGDKEFDLREADRALRVAMKVSNNLILLIVDKLIKLGSLLSSRYISSRLGRELIDGVPFKFRGSGSAEIMPGLEKYFTSVPIRIWSSRLEDMDSRDSERIHFIADTCRKTGREGGEIALRFLERAIDSGAYVWLFNILTEIKAPSALISRYLSSLVTAEHTELLKDKEKSPDFSIPVPYIFNHEQHRKFPVRMISHQQCKNIKLGCVRSIEGELGLESFIDGLPMDNCVITGSLLGSTYYNVNYGGMFTGTPHKRNRVVPLIPPGKSEYDVAQFIRNSMSTEVSIKNPTPPYGTGSTLANISFEKIYEVGGKKKDNFNFYMTWGDALHIVYLGGESGLESLSKEIFAYYSKFVPKGVIVPLKHASGKVYFIYDASFLLGSILLYSSTLADIFRTSSPLERIVLGRSGEGKTPEYHVLMTASYIQEALSMNGYGSRGSSVIPSRLYPSMQDDPTIEEHKSGKFTEDPPVSIFYWNPRPIIDRTELYEPISIAYKYRGYYYWGSYINLSENIIATTHKGEMYNLNVVPDDKVNPFFTPVGIIKHRENWVYDNRILREGFSPESGAEVIC